MRRTLRRIYVAGAYTAPTPHGIAENINAAADLAEDLRAAGFLPYVPHTGLAGARAVGVDLVEGEGRKQDVFLCLPDLTWDEAMDDCRDLLPRMDALILVPGWQESRGAKEEKALAEAEGLPVFFTLAALRAASEEVA